MQVTMCTFVLATGLLAASFWIFGLPKREGRAAEETHARHHLNGGSLAGLAIFYVLLENMQGRWSQRNSPNREEARASAPFSPHSWDARRPGSSRGSPGSCSSPSVRAAPTCWFRLKRRSSRAPPAAVGISSITCRRNCRVVRSLAVALVGHSLRAQSRPEVRHHLRPVFVSSLLAVGTANKRSATSAISAPACSAIVAFTFLQNPLFEGFILIGHTPGILAADRPVRADDLGRRHQTAAAVLGMCSARARR